MENKKNTRSRRGARAAMLSGVAVVLFLALNIGLAQLPKNVFELDTTGNSLYSVSEQAERFLSGVTQDVEIIILARSGSIDERLSKLIYNYAALSPRITIRELDPAVNPSVLDTYSAQEGTVVVRCEVRDKSEVISIAGFKDYTDGLILYDYASYLQGGVRRPVALDAEGQLTAAISRVTGAEGPAVYAVTGHGESVLSPSVAAQLEKLSITPQPINLLQSGLVPSDCELLICINPTADLAAEELTMLSLYLKNGGKLMMMMEKSDMPNFNALLALYGLEVRPGYIADTERYYESYFSYYSYNCIYPVLARTGVTSGITGDALIIYPRGMTQITPERAGSSVQAFMTTSSSAVNYIDENTVYEGQYILGAVAVEDIEERGQSRLTVITAMSLIDDSIISSVQGAANLEIFTNAVTANLSGSVTAIPAKSLNIAYNTPRSAGPWNVFFIGFMPAAFIICGLSVWLERRKR